jgi:lysophospholipase L1-like esterase
MSRFLALGDSYTIGEGVKESRRWPNQLADLLLSRGHPLEVSILARTGWTTDELWQGMQAQDILPPYDLVSLLIGVNNQYRGYALEEYRDQFSFLLNQAIQYAGGDPKRVLVLSIPDWGVTPFAEGHDRAKVCAQIEVFNAVNRTVSEQGGVWYVDVTPVSRLALTDPALLAADGLHPSGRMYTLWAELALPAALAALQAEALP